MTSLDMLNKFGERLNVAAWGGRRLTNRKLAKLFGICEKSFYNHRDDFRFADGRPCQTVLDLVGLLDEKAKEKRRRILAQLGLFEPAPTLYGSLGLDA